MRSEHMTWSKIAEGVCCVFFRGFGFVVCLVLLCNTCPHKYASQSHLDITVECPVMVISSVSAMMHFPDLSSVRRSPPT